VEVEGNKGQKARYFAPTLVIYGDMAKFTAAGAGSKVELTMQPLVTRRP